MKTEKEKLSYVIDQQIGNDFLRQGIEIDSDIFINSFKDALSGKKSEFSLKEMQEVMVKFQQDMQRKKQEKEDNKGKENLEKGKAFLAENRKKDGIIETCNFVQKEGMACLLYDKDGAV